MKILLSHFIIITLVSLLVMISITPIVHAQLYSTVPIPNVGPITRMGDLDPPKLPSGHNFDIGCDDVNENKKLIGNCPIFDQSYYLQSQAWDIVNYVKSDILGIP